MNKFLVFLTLVFLAVASGMKPHEKAISDTSKPLCGLCVNIVKQLDSVLEHGGDIEAAVDKFCKEDVPSFMVDMCEKIIEKNLEFIIEKLKDHEPADKICTDIFLCRVEKQSKSKSYYYQIEN